MLRRPWFYPPGLRRPHELCQESHIGTLIGGTPIYARWPFPLPRNLIYQRYKLQTIQILQAYRILGWRNHHFRFSFFSFSLSFLSLELVERPGRGIALNNFEKPEKGFSSPVNWGMLLDFDFVLFELELFECDESKDETEDILSSN